MLQLQIGDLSLSAAGLISPLPGSNIGYSLLVTGSLLGLEDEHQAFERYRSLRAEERLYF